MNLQIALFCYFYTEFWPKYLLGFLNTAALNPLVHFYFVTHLKFEDKSWSESYGNFKPPKNIFIISKTLNQVCDEVNSIYHPKVNLSNIQPYKVNDFKPIIGRLLESYLHNYTHWGYFDPDLLLGDIISVYSPYLHYDMVSYSEIYAQGPLMIIKNTNKTRQLDQYVSTSMMDAILQPIPKTVDEVYFSKFLKSDANFTKIILNADCEPQFIWIYYQGKLFGQNGECAVVHFGGGRASISRVKKFKLQTLAHTYLNITSKRINYPSNERVKDFAFGFARWPGHGALYYFFEINNNDNTKFDFLNISLSDQESAILTHLSTGISTVWKKLRSDLK
mmetsp:Transcript_19076/g.19817  ORF Transcript_19076/g.19817 Transcript_19076/m.19817 type:complete len:334 (-) Transcript_19076:104-1105(-)